MDYRNQTPEQQARDQIDQLLEQSGWVVQDKKRINLSASQGVAVLEPTSDLLALRIQTEKTANKMVVKPKTLTKKVTNTALLSKGKS